MATACTPHGAQMFNFRPVLAAIQETKYIIYLY